MYASVLTFIIASTTFWTYCFSPRTCFTLIIIRFLFVFVFGNFKLDGIYFNLVNSSSARWWICMCHNINFLVSTCAHDRAYSFIKRNIRFIKMYDVIRLNANIDLHSFDVFLLGKKKPLNNEYHNYLIGGGRLKMFCKSVILHIIKTAIMEV